MSGSFTERLWELEDQLDFGKHEGRTIEWVMENDNAYFVWMCENGLEYNE